MFEKRSTLEPGAFKAVNNCMKTTNKDIVVVITDNDTKHIASAIEKEAKKNNR